VSAELYVIFLKVLENPPWAAVAAVFGFLMLTAFWYVLPLMQRLARKAERSAGQEFDRDAARS
jgi:hypothetical protein